MGKEEVQDKRIVYRGAKEIGEALGITEPTALKQIKSGRIPAFKIGGTWVIEKDFLKNWLSEQSKKRVKRGG